MMDASVEQSAERASEGGTWQVPMPDDVSGDMPDEPVPDAISLTDAAVRLGRQTIWDAATLSVRAGEYIAVLGPNGAGKSTLLNALLGLVPLSAGQARVLGQPVRRGNPHVSYLPQRRVFDADTRIRGRDLVRLGLEGTRWGIPLPALRALFGGMERVVAEHFRVDQVLELVGATSYANRPIGELSGGEQQRVLIAQALVTRPRLLLLDEPLDGLDPPNQRAVASLIGRIRSMEGVTVLLVAHDVNPLLPYLDRVIYIARGQVLIGEPREVITTEALSRLYGADVEVLQTSDGRLFVAGQPGEGITHHA